MSRLADEEERSRTQTDQSLGEGAPSLLTDCAFVVVLGGFLAGRDGVNVPRLGETSVIFRLVK